MARRTVRKLTTWSDAEWAHVAAEAASAGVPPLRFVREAALGMRTVSSRFGGNSGGMRWACGSGDKAAEVVVCLTRMLGSLRRLSLIEGEGSQCGQLLASAIVAVEAAILKPAHADAFADSLGWMVMPYADAIVEIERLAAARRTFPPDFAICPLLAGILACAG